MRDDSFGRPILADPKRRFGWSCTQGGKTETGGSGADLAYGAVWKLDQSGPVGGKPLPIDFLGTKYGDTVQAFGAFFPPHDPNTTFVTSSSHGVWISVGGTPFVEWKAIPYLRVQRLRWLPTGPGEPGAVQVATFGAGAWLLDRVCFVLTDLNKFSNDQVDSLLAQGSPARFSQAFYVVFEGFSPADLSFTASTPTAPPPSNLSPIVDVTQANCTILTNPKTTVDSVFFSTSPLELGTVQLTEIDDFCVGHLVANAIAPRVWLPRPTERRCRVKCPDSPDSSS